MACPPCPSIAGDAGRAFRGGLAVAVQARPHDAPDGDDEQDGEGHRRADEGGGEDGGRMRQISESAVVGGQPLGYPSPFIEVY